MNKIQSILYTKAYQTEDNRIVFITNKVMLDLIEKYENIKNIPEEVTIKAFLLEHESDIYNPEIYKLSFEIDINHISKLTEISVRCSIFSDYI